MVKLWLRWMHIVVCIFAAFRGFAASEDDYYRLIDVAVARASTDSRSSTWKPAPAGLALEVGGIEAINDHQLAVAIRKGEVWILDGVYDDPPANVTYKQFASALHEPLGLLKHKDALYAAQRSELTALKDTDRDGAADEYLTAAQGWGVSGHYHEYAYGPKLDRDGNLWVTLNTGLGRAHQERWRGWGMKITPTGALLPVCAGMRSPCGLGANRAGDMFYTDQQGEWVATNSLHHMREGAFFHHPGALASTDQPDSPIRDVGIVPDGVPYPKAIAAFPLLKPPAVWFPYKKMGQSATDIVLDASNGKFGPFAGQLFVGEFTQAGMSRVYLEQVEGEYQGACFPFRSGFASAVLRMAQGTDGSMFAGLTNRGWSSLGTASYGLQRLVWTGKVPFEIQEMRAKNDGFELVFTKPLDPTTAADLKSYEMQSYTYMYHSTYGSDEIQSKQLPLSQALVSADGYKVHLVVPGIRPLFVHELTAKALRSQEGEPLLHHAAYYTLNRIPASE